MRNGEIESNALEEILSGLKSNLARRKPILFSDGDPVLLAGTLEEHEGGRGLAMDLLGREDRHQLGRELLVAHKAAGGGLPLPRSGGGLGRGSSSVLQDVNSPRDWQFSVPIDTLQQKAYTC